MFIEHIFQSVSNSTSMYIKQQSVCDAQSTVVTWLTAPVGTNNTMKTNHLQKQMLQEITLVLTLLHNLPLATSSFIPLPRPHSFILLARPRSLLLSPSTTHPPSLSHPPATSRIVSSHFLRPVTFLKESVAPSAIPPDSSDARRRPKQVLQTDNPGPTNPLRRSAAERPASQRCP